MQNCAKPSEELALFVIAMQTLPGFEKGFLREILRQLNITAEKDRLA